MKEIVLKALSYYGHIVGNDRVVVPPDKLGEIVEKVVRGLIPPKYSIDMKNMSGDLSLSYKAGWDECRALMLKRIESNDENKTA